MVSIAFFAIGMLAGFLGGLLGIGGGVLIIPSLCYLLPLLASIPSESITHTAIGTSLATVLLNTAVATWAQHKRKAVRWDLVRRFLPGLLIGTILGALLADLTPDQELSKIFGIVMALFGFFFMSKKKLNFQTPLSLKICLTAGFLIGALAGLLGIGGGIITVPILIAFHLEEKRAVATSIAMGIFTSITGTILFSFFGQGFETAPGTLGFIYLPAFLWIGLGGVLFSPLGVRTSHFLPAHHLRKIFALLLIAVGLLMMQQV